MGAVSLAREVGRSGKPFRRFLARMLDYEVFFVAVAVAFSLAGRADPLRRSFANDGFLALMAISFFWIPIEALLLSICGVTPGKAICGIRVRSELAGRIHPRAAVDRSLSVWVFGISGGFPIAYLVAMEQAYRDLTERGETGWDRSKFKVEARPLGFGRRLLIGAAIIALVLAGGVLIAQRSTT